jgi:FkbM family methyltransferase
MYLMRLISKILYRLGTNCFDISRKIYQPPQSPQQQRVQGWFQTEGDKTLRLNYDLNASSLVLDLGGHTGQWASDIFSMYCCTIHIFEPLIEFASDIKQRFLKNEKIFVHNFGLSNEDKMVKISINGTSSSIYKEGEDVGSGRLVKAISFLQDNHIEKIDLMKINIEGAEYDLLEHLIDAGLISNINNIQVQFHDFVSNAEQRMIMLQKKLKNTHSLTYQYPFVWENWRVK